MTLINEELTLLIFWLLTTNPYNDIIQLLKDDDNNFYKECRLQ